MDFDFIHLHARSEYSFDSGFFNVDDYVKICYENEYKSAVLTEKLNLFSAVKFYNSCIDFGIKPIIGCELFLENDSSIYTKIILLCKNYIGYRNLVTILAKSHLDSKNDLPLVKYKWLSELSDGLIAIGLSVDSDIGRSLINNNFNDAIEFLNFWNFSFKNRFYLSLTKIGLPGEFTYLNRIFEFSVKYRVSLVATNEVSFLRREDIYFYRSKIVMFDPEGSRLSQFYEKHLDNKYFKSNKEMKMLFGSIPNVLYNTIELAKRCNLFFKFGANYSPKFVNTDGLSIETFLFKFTFNKLILDRFFLNSFDLDIYFSRLKTELMVISNIGFSNYFLVTHEFIIWAKTNDVFVGPGRGSGAGSLVAYLLSITGIDPIANDLLFERFLNKERISSPDFDVDFCIEGRDLIMDYIFDFYGINNVSQIITFGCMTAKSVIRDVGRILGYSYSFIDKIIKSLDIGFGFSLKTELAYNYKLRSEYDASFDIQTILNLSLKIEGVIKGIGKHAGGLIISCVPLLGYLPMQYEASEFNFISQFDKDDADLFGFTKFDFLGLKTLTIISDVIDTLCSYYSMSSNFFLELDYAFFDDSRTYHLLGRGDTLGIFQFESIGIKGVLQKVKPDVFSDLISLIALYRPGPLQSGLLTSFARRKTGEEKIDYIHPILVPILRETYGMLVYQEQVMLIAQIFANYSLADADFLRRVMSKKKIRDMDMHLANFVYGASLNKVDYNSAEEVFYLIEKFAGYGFNKAHSVGYALLAYVSAWLKANYNIIFLSVLLSSDMDDNSDVDFYINECEYFGVNVLLPDVNRSSYCFTISNEKNMLFGFGFIKGLGKSLISEIIFIRAIFGFYGSFFDFLYRIDLTLLTKKVLQSLVYSGMFDKLDNCRFKLVLISNKVFDLYANLANFSSFNSAIDKFFNNAVKNFYYMIEYKNIELFNSRFLLGSVLSVNSMLNYISDLLSIHELSYKSGCYFNEFFCGVIEEIKLLSKKLYRIKISGLYDSRSVLLSESKHKYKKDLMKLGKLVVICIYYDKNEFNELFIEDFFFFRSMFAKYFDIYFSSCFISDVFLNKLFFVFFNKAITGSTKVRFFYFFNGGYKLILLKLNLNISLHDDLISEIKKFKEIYDVSTVYSFF